MTQANCEIIIESLGLHFEARQGVRVPFLFGLVALRAHQTKGLTSCCWLPQRSTVRPLEQRHSQSGRTAEEVPRFEKLERFTVICWDRDRAAAEALHLALIDALASSPLTVDLGDYEWETEQEQHAAPNLRGSSIAQEVAFVTIVPNAPPRGGVTLWTVRQVDHGCAVAHDDGSEEEQHIITEA